MHQGYRIRALFWNLDWHCALLVVGVGQQRPPVKGVVTQENGR